MSGERTILISVPDQAVKKILDIYDYNLRTLKKMQDKNQCLPHEAAEIMQSIKQCAATLRTVQAMHRSWKGLDGILDARINALAGKNQETHQAMKLDEAEGEGRR